MASFEEKRSGEWAKSRKGCDRKSDRTRQKNKRRDIYIEKWDQTKSPEIPDRGGETSKILSLPSGDGDSLVLTPPNSAKHQFEHTITKAKPEKKTRKGA